MSTSNLGRRFRARATNAHFAVLPTEIPIPAERRNPVPDIEAKGLLWYACTTIPQGEMRAADSLRRESPRMAAWGLPAFVPYVPCQARWIARTRGSTALPRREVQTPRLRSYVFIGIEGGIRAAHLNVLSERNVERRNRHGLIAILGAGNGVPICFGEGDVDFLARRAKEERDEAIVRVVGKTELADGDRVEVVDGPFLTYFGSVTGVDANAGRAQVELELLGRAVPIELDFDAVRKVA